VTAPRDLPRDIGGFIRDLRRNAQISLRQLAEQAGVSNPYLSQIERGLRKPSAEVLAQLAHALRVSTPVMYLRAGLLDSRDGQGVLAAIAADPDLTIAQKQSLTQIYETFRRENARNADAEPAESSAVEPPAEAVAVEPAATPAPAATAGQVSKLRKAAAKRPARSTAEKPSAEAASADDPGAKENTKEK
jgi:transcriptional regulator with XRE-family HTH domain